MVVIEGNETFELSLTNLRKLWLSKETVIKDFLNYLVQYQGKFATATCAILKNIA